MKRLFEYDGERLTQSEIARREGVSPSTIWDRLRRHGAVVLPPRASKSLGPKRPQGRPPVVYDVGGERLTAKEIAPREGVKIGAVHQRAYRGRLKRVPSRGHADGS